MTTDPFAPFGGPKAEGGARRAPRSSASEWSIVVPVPESAPLPPSRHPTLGAPSAQSAYRDAGGALLGFACRFDGPDGKQFRPLALFQGGARARLEWRWESWPAPRPLYGLDRLADRSGAPVLVCEGEKAADAAARLLPGFVAVTSPNGSKSAEKADWSPLRGRAVTIWPDADAPGRKYAEEVARLCAAAGAASVAILAPPGGVKAGWDAADAEAERYAPERLAQLIAAGAPVAGETGGASANNRNEGEKGARRRRPAARLSLIGLTEFCDFWHSPDAIAYVTIPVNGHRENWKVRSERFKRWLAKCAYEEIGMVPGAQAIEETLRIFEARAINDGPQRIPLLRVGDRGGRWYLDLCDPEWRVIEISEEGWSVLDRHDLPFVRSDAMLPLPAPEAGYQIEDLRRFVNVCGDFDFMCVAAWLVAALHYRGEYPILIIQGEQGSGKSTFSRLLRSLVDPNKAPIRAAPKDEEDLVIAAKNGHVIALDNLSRIDATMADALCRLSTGAGFSTRVKYTNDEEHVAWACNPILINGIPALAERPDLARRALIVHLLAISEEQRQPEDEFWRDWETNAPRVLGALCDALSTALRRLPSVKLARAQSMAYFEKLIEAASLGLGWEPGAFSEAYAANRKDLDDEAIEANLVGMAIIDLIRNEFRDGWTGTATQLLDLLTSRAAEGTKRSRSWPQKAQMLGNELERLKPLLRGRGILLDRRHSGERKITIAAKRE